MKQRDEERERNITKRMKQYEEKYDFINKALLESVAHITEMTKTDHPTAAAKVKSADKMVMSQLLFDGSKPEVAKQHYERFYQYINFQTKSGNIRDPIAEVIELFEHTLDKKALVWFQEHKDKFVDVTTLKTMFLQRYNPWGKTKRDQLQSWNILTFYPQKTGVNEHINLINTLGDMLGQTVKLEMEKFVDTMPTIEAKILDDFSEVKICVVEVNAVKICTKANITETITKVIITKETVFYITSHIEIINKVTIMANFEAEAMVMAEVITTDVATAGLIIKAITTISTISIMVMMMGTRQINMAHHVHYAVAIIIPPNIVLRENMILMTSWRK